MTTTGASSDEDEDDNDADGDDDNADDEDDREEDEDENASPCHRSSRMHLPTSSPLAAHISAQPLLNLTCLWPAVRKHSIATGQRLPATSWIETEVPILKSLVATRRFVFFENTD